MKASSSNAIEHHFNLDILEEEHLLGILFFLKPDIGSTHSLFQTTLPQPKNVIWSVDDATCPGCHLAFALWKLEDSLANPLNRSMDGFDKMNWFITFYSRRPVQYWEHILESERSWNRWRNRHAELWWKKQNQHNSKERFANGGESVHVRADGSWREQVKVLSFSWQENLRWT